MKHVSYTLLPCLQYDMDGSGYIHDCRNSSDTKGLFSRQPFPMPKILYARLPCIKYNCRASSIKVLRLFTRQPFPIPKRVYTRLPCIKYKSVIYTASISHAKKFIYTAAVHQVKKVTCIYTAAVSHAKKCIYTAALHQV